MTLPPMRVEIIYTPTGERVWATLVGLKGRALTVMHPVRQREIHFQADTGRPCLKTGKRATSYWRLAEPIRRAPSTSQSS